jgi:general secretion pathway protein G
MKETQGGKKELKPPLGVTRKENNLYVGGNSPMIRNKGFTLVEILIVVIILGILAAIVIPQFSSASNDARESALTSDLQTLRSQLELYNIQHLDHYPDVQSTDSGTTWTADTANFSPRLTGQSSQYGQISAGAAFGPYMQNFPTNAFNGLNTVRVNGAVPGAGTHGWQFTTATGRLSADDNATHGAL